MIFTYIVYFVYKMMISTYIVYIMYKKMIFTHNDFSALYYVD